MSFSLPNILLSVLALSLFSCTGTPQNIDAVKNFQNDRYLGKWYEIARLDHHFEKNLDRVSATYTKRVDGGITVVNSGRNVSTNETKSVEGKAYFVKEPTTAHLKVSFFGPFYASYIVFEIDPNYQFAFVTGNSKDYLWLLSRTSSIDKKAKLRFMKRARELGFDTSKIIWVNQQ